MPDKKEIVALAYECAIVKWIGVHACSYKLASIFVEYGQKVALSGPEDKVAKRMENVCEAFDKALADNHLKVSEVNLSLACVICYMTKVFCKRHDAQPETYLEALLLLCLKMLRCGTIVDPGETSRKDAEAEGITVQ